MASPGAARNPYDREDTCRCCAYSEGECACGGYVDRGKVRAWQQGYDAAHAEIERLEAVCDHSGALAESFAGRWREAVDRAEAAEAALAAHEATR